MRLLTIRGGADGLSLVMKMANLTSERTHSRDFVAVPNIWLKKIYQRGQDRDCWWKPCGSLVVLLRNMAP